MSAKLFIIDLVGFEWEQNHEAVSRPLTGEGQNEWVP